MSNRSTPTWPPRRVVRPVLVLGLVLLTGGIAWFADAIADSEFPFGALILTTLGVMMFFAGFVALYPQWSWLARAVLFLTPIAAFAAVGVVEANRGRTGKALEAAFACVVLATMWFMQARRSRGRRAGPSA